MLSSFSKIHVRIAVAFVLSDSFPLIPQKRGRVQEKGRVIDIDATTLGHDVDQDSS
jgi:hypothetical protein